MAPEEALMKILRLIDGADELKDEKRAGPGNLNKTISGISA